MSHRGQRLASKKDVSSKFAELRALKTSGKRRIDTYEEIPEDDLYEEVDEAGYKKILRDRLEKDDFVVDDNGLGYADNGTDEWDNHSDDSEQGTPSRKRTSNTLLKNAGRSALAQEGSISKYLKNTAMAKPSIVVHALKWMRLVLISRLQMSKTKISWQSYWAKFLAILVITNASVQGTRIPQSDTGLESPRLES